MEGTIDSSTHSSGLTIVVPVENNTNALETDRLRQLEKLKLEFELKNVDAQLAHNKQLLKTQQDLKDAYEKIGQMQKIQRSLCEQIDVLRANLKTTTDKYTEATSVLEKNSECKGRCSTIDGQINKLMTERDEAMVALENLQNDNEAKRILHEKGKQDLEQRLNGLFAKNTALNDQLSAEKQNIDKYRMENASIKQEKNRIESELAALQMTNQTIIEEKNKLADDILVIEQTNERMSNEMDEITNKLVLRDAELQNEKHTSAQIRKIAKKYKDLFFELQKKHEALVAEKTAQQLNEQTEQILNNEIKELNRSIVDKQQHNESLQMKIETLSNRLSEIDAKHVAALNTIQTMTAEKERSTLELTAHRTKIESGIKIVKNMIDKDKKQKEEIARLMRENEALQGRLPVAQHRSQLTGAPSTKPSTLTGEKGRSDAGLTIPTIPIAGTTIDMSINYFYF